MLILVAHGSRDPLWRGTLEKLAESVGAGMPSEEVRVAFMQFEGPTLQEVVSEAAGAGQTNLRLLPLFMASAGHVDKDIKPLVAELARAHPGVKLNLMAPVGEDDLFPRLLVDIATKPSTPG
ncbi:MAG: CbiX/SirB N-terminal domain-containing protein [Gemmatimonadota bacterium]